MTKDEKLSDYYFYICAHVSNVRDAYANYKDILFNILNITISEEEMNNIIKKHDATKWSGEEFEYYQKYFMPVDDMDKATKLEFDKAWLHHINCNYHHPEHWVIYDHEFRSVRFIPMPDHYIAEMICDWIAMGMTHDSKVYEWYDKNKINIPLHEETRKKVEKTLMAIKDFDSH